MFAISPVRRQTYNSFAHIRSSALPVQLGPPLLWRSSLQRQSGPYTPLSVEDILSRRWYASIPRPTQTSSKPDANGLPPPDPPRKPKVELRPSPKRVEPSSPSSSQPTPTQETTTSATKASQRSSPVPPLPIPTSQATSKSKPSTLDIAIADVQHASREGILAPAPPDASWFGRIYHSGKELFKFYWRGLKALWKHGNIVKEIQQRTREEGREMGWREKRFVAVYRKDQLKLIPFVLILLVIEELLPLVVIWAPFLLPSTCILPSQRERIEKKRLEKQLQALNAARVALRSSRPSETPSLQFMDADLVKALCGVLSLSTWGPSLLARSRLSSQLSKLSADDALLQPSLPSLDIHELREAVSERGGIADEADERKLRDWLAKWLVAALKSEKNGEENASRRLQLLITYARMPSQGKRNA